MKTLWIHIHDGEGRHALSQVNVTDRMIGTMAEDQVKYQAMMIARSLLSPPLESRERIDGASCGESIAWAGRVGTITEVDEPRQTIKVEFAQ